MKNKIFKKIFELTNDGYEVLISVYANRVIIRVAERDHFGFVAAQELSRDEIFYIKEQEVFVIKILEKLVDEIAYRRKEQFENLHNRLQKEEKL